MTPKTCWSTDHVDMTTLHRIWQNFVGPGALLDEPVDVLLGTCDIPVFVATTRARVPHIHPDCPHVEVANGSGCGLTRLEAQMRALGEAIERYSAWRCCTPEAIQSTFRELGSLGISPRQFPLYADEQYAAAGFHFQPLTDTTVLEWVEGFSWRHEQSRLLPTCFVYQQPCLGSSKCMYHTVSTGLACGLTPEDARLSGLCEVIERDAMMIAWLNGLALPRLQPPVEDPVLAEIYRRIAQRNMHATVLDATTDVGLPVRIALLESRRGMSWECAVGMAARPDPILAHRKSLLEACHTLNWLHQMRQRRPHSSVEEVLLPETFAEHVVLYSHARAKPFLDFWRQGPWRQEVTRKNSEGTQPVQQFEQLVQRLDVLGLDVITIDVTLPEVADAGLHVFRSVVPGMVPLTAGPEACLGSTRLQTVPAQMACKAHYSNGKWNPYPHPFP